MSNILTANFKKSTMALLKKATNHSFLLLIRLFVSHRESVMIENTKTKYQNKNVRIL